MLTVLFIFVLLALLLSITGWMLFFILSMDVVYREVKEQYGMIRYKLRQRRGYGSEKKLPAEAWPIDEIDEIDEMWEDTAVAMWRDGRELAAITAVQEQTGLDYEAAKVKLFKLDEEWV